MLTEDADLQCYTDSELSVMQRVKLARKLEVGLGVAKDEDAAMTHYAVTTGFHLDSFR